MADTPTPASDGCLCPDRLVDHVRRTVLHPYTYCPHYGTTTRLDADTEAEEWEVA